MSKKGHVIFVVALLVTFAAQGQTVEQILARADAAFELEQVYSKSTLTVTRNGRPQAPQTMEVFELEAADGTARSLSVFSAPPRMAGTAYLIIGDDLWVRFASTGRIRKMSSSAKTNSAAGSDFSYADMGNGSASFTEDYAATLSGTERIDNVDTWRIDLSPKEEAGLYERMVVWITKDLYQYIRVQYYENGAPVKQMVLSDYRTVGIAQYPFRITMRNLAQDSVSEIITDTIEPMSPKVEDRFFSQAYLRTIK